jgi:hypothetical protein
MGKPIRSIHIEPALNGGHTVTHNFKEMTRPGKHGLSYAPPPSPEVHVFGADEGHDMLAHVANTLSIPAASGEPGDNA